MKNENRNFTFLEVLMVIAILLFAGTIAAQDIMRAVRTSERNKVHAISREYSAVRNMYAQQYRPSSGSAPNTSNR
jgi:type II secretory pathway pseudopilin PulG